tara:strand:- start:140 stop:337 length:198 start_codon:yes stop_codon:yes gene_type:complete
MGAANSKQVLVLENIPIVGHCIALKHAIDGNGAAARRAAIKSTNGLIGHWRLSCQARALGSRAYL